MQSPTTTRKRASKAAAAPRMTSSRAGRTAYPAPDPEALALATALSKEYGSLRRFAEAARIKYVPLYRSLYPERFPRQKAPAFTLAELEALRQEHPAGPLPGLDLTDDLRTALRTAFDARYERYTDLSNEAPKLKADWLSAFFLSTGSGRITPKVRALASVLNVAIPERLKA